MKTRKVLVAAAVLGAAILTGASAASPVPYLRSASAVNRHVVVVYSLGDLLPGRVLVATKTGRDQSGRFIESLIRLNEPLTGKKVAGGLRMRTRHTLRPGRYYVEVSGTVVGLDCTPKKPCPKRWSNLRRVVVK